MTICDGILYSVTVVKISSLSSRPSRKGKYGEKITGTDIQRFITGIVPVPSCRNEEYLSEIEKALMEKLDSMVKRQLYTTFKTAPTEEEREKARQEYLDKCGMHENFRW